MKILGEEYPDAKTGDFVFLSANGEMGEPYIIAYTGKGYMFISMLDGNRWTDAIEESIHDLFLLNYEYIKKIILRRDEEI